ncbi:hypothetical protein [Legionella sp.]|uniref:hypothetical protein n=1 Tax=Legionella sp. TaxID=459 RepID=UPI003CC6100E
MLKNVVKIILVNEDSKTIKETSEHRKYLLQFLSSIMDLLSSNTKSPIFPKYKPHAFYGALFIVINHLNRTRWLGSMFLFFLHL